MVDRPRKRIRSVSLATYEAERQGVGVREERGREKESFVNITVV